MKATWYMRDFRILPGRTDLRSSAVLRSVWWQFLADVSGQPICPSFKRKEILILEHGTDNAYI
jgi:hypothetical protein